jgi:hypothetical protein
LSRRGNEIVTAQHSDYTGAAWVLSRSGIDQQSPVTSAYPILDVSTIALSHFPGDLAIHDRSHF